MSKIREAYLQRCEIGLLDRERNEGLRLCRENDIVRWGRGGGRGREVYRDTVATNSGYEFLQQPPRDAAIRYL